MNWSNMFSKENCKRHFLVSMFHKELWKYFANSLFVLQTQTHWVTLQTNQPATGAREAQSLQWLYYKLNDCGLSPGKFRDFSFQHHVQIS